MQAEGAALGLELLDWPCFAQQCQKEAGRHKLFGSKPDRDYLFLVANISVLIG